METGAKQKQPEKWQKCQAGSKNQKKKKSVQNNDSSLPFFFLCSFRRKRTNKQVHEGGRD